MQIIGNSWLWKGIYDIYRPSFKLYGLFIFSYRIDQRQFVPTELSRAVGFEPGWFSTLLYRAHPGKRAVCRRDQDVSWRMQGAGFKIWKTMKIRFFPGYLSFYPAIFPEISVRATWWNAMLDILPKIQYILPGMV